MENLLHDLAAHGLKGRRVALIESGSWAISAGKGMRDILSPLKDTEYICDGLSFKSRLSSVEGIDEIADAIGRTM